MYWDYSSSFIEFLRIEDGRTWILSRLSAPENCSWDIFERAICWTACLELYCVFRVFLFVRGYLLVGEESQPDFKTLRNIFWSLSKLAGKKAGGSTRILEEICNFHIGFACGEFWVGLFECSVAPYGKNLTCWNLRRQMRQSCLFKLQVYHSFRPSTMCMIRVQLWYHVVCDWNLTRAVQVNVGSLRVKHNRPIFCVDKLVHNKQWERVSISEGDTANGTNRRHNVQN